MWTLYLCVLTIPMLSSPGHLHSSEELLFVCIHPVTPQTHSLRTRPGQGSSFNSGHLLLLSIAKLFVISHFPNLFSIHCSATVHNQDEGCNNTLRSCVAWCHYFSMFQLMRAGFNFFFLCCCLVEILKHVIACTLTCMMFMLHFTVVCMLFSLSRKKQMMLADWLFKGIISCFFKSGVVPYTVYNMDVVSVTSSTCFPRAIVKSSMVAMVVAFLTVRRLLAPV